MEEEKQAGLISKLGDLFWSFVFIAGGAALGLFLTYSGAQEYLQYKHWDEYQQTQGTVNKLYIYSVDHTSTTYGVAKTSTSWRIGAEYTYLSDDQHKHFKTGEIESFSTEEDARTALLNHHADESIEVWFHPDTPDESILAYQKPTLGNAVWFMLFGGLIVLFFINMILSFFKKEPAKED